MIRLHHCKGTRSDRTLWLLYEIGVAFDLVVHPFDKSLRAPDYAALNPAGRVPALEIDGAVMTETGAIAEYLCETFPECGLGRFAGDGDRRDWLVWIHFAETVSQHCAALTQQHVAIYPASERSALIMSLESRRLTRVLSVIEGRLTQSGAYLLASGFSAADIGVGQAVDMARRFVDLSQFPQVAAWHARLFARPAAQRLAKVAGAGLYDREFYAVPEGP